MLQRTYMYVLPTWSRRFYTTIYNSWLPYTELINICTAADYTSISLVRYVYQTIISEYLNSKKYWSSPTRSHLCRSSVLRRQTYSPAIRVRFPLICIWVIGGIIKDTRPNCSSAPGKVPGTYGVNTSDPSNRMYDFKRSKHHRHHHHHRVYFRQQTLATNILTEQNKRREVLCKN